MTENMMNTVLVNSKEVESNSLMKKVLEKLKEFLLMLENFDGYFIDWVENLFPPETRGEKLRQWLQVGVLCVIIGLVLLVSFCCCRCWCRRRRAMKMMKAPGRDYMMPRHVFESDPRSYFRNLRENPQDDDELFLPLLS